MDDPTTAAVAFNASTWWTAMTSSYQGSGSGEESLEGDTRLVGSNNSIITTGLLANRSMADEVTFSGVDPAFVRFRDESRFWIQRVLLPIIGTIGVFGNVVTILILTRRGMRTSTNAYLTALAVADLVYLICVFWLSLRHYPNVKEDPVLSSIYAYAWPYSLWLTDATTNTSVWLTVTFTVERYIAVAHPMRGRMLCTESRARKVIIGVYLVCFTATLTTPFEWTVVEVTDPETNVSKAEIAPSQLGNDETYQTIYYWFTSITFVLLPLTLLIIFNSFLIQSVRQSQKLREVMTARQTVSDREERAATHEIRITTTLIAVVIMFLVCQLPTAATLIYKIFHEPKPASDEEAVLRALGNIFNCLVSLNAACNFLLYCALSDKYRRTFMLTFCRCLYRPASPVHSMAFFTQMEGVHEVGGGASHHHGANSVRQPSFRTNAPMRRHSSRMAHPPTLQRRVSNNQRNNNAYLALPASGNGSPASPRMTNHTSSIHRMSVSLQPSSPLTFSSSPQSRTSLIRNKWTNPSPPPSSSSSPFSASCWPWRHSGTTAVKVPSEAALVQVPVNVGQSGSDRPQRPDPLRLDEGDEVSFV